MTAGRPRILVVGGGSIGRRHTENLLRAGARVAIYDVDPICSVVGADLHPAGLADLDGFAGVVVASPSALHLEHARAALASGMKVLVEKPLATTMTGVDDLLALGGDRIMVGYNQRLHEPNERLVSLVQAGRVGRVVGVRVWSGSYLPDWRPGADYRRVYSAQSRLGGGVLLDASHELDLLVWLLGPELRVVGAVVERLGDLEIDVEDTVHALVRAPDGAVGEADLDYLSRRYRRGIEVVGTEATARLDRARRVLEIDEDTGMQTEPADIPADLSYVRQTERFLAWLLEGRPPPVDGYTGAASVRLADAIRRAARPR